MIDVLRPVFASTFCYALVKLVGQDNWPAVRRYELDHLRESQWPGFRTLHQLSRVVEKFDCHVDGSTYITLARCIAAGHFLSSGHDVWVTVDDDVYADARVVRDLVVACRQTRGLVALPYVNRDGGSMTFRRVVGPTIWTPGLGDQAPIPLRAVDRVGMGLVAMHRNFVQTLAQQNASFHEHDGPGSLLCPGIFLEGPLDGIWTGEDYWCCQLAEEAELPMHVLLDAEGTHAGIAAKLDLEGRVELKDPERHRYFEESTARKNELHAARLAEAGASPEP